MPAKKVYAVYHNPRYTRETNGESIVNWKLCRTSEASRARIKRYNYNADLIDGNDRHELAAVNYPLIGMQAQNDTDYLEYQVLLAKMAGIDGFLTDFRHLEDKPGIEQCQLLQQVAAKYGFEIGLDWCDAQIFYTLEKYKPELDTRAKQIDYCKNIFQYIFDTVYAHPTAANWEGHPIIFLFGFGFEFDEYKYLHNQPYRLPEGMKEPWFFRRAQMDCAEVDGRVEYTYDTRLPFFAAGNRDEIAGPFGWIPFRVRDAVAAGLDLWDVYATREDCIAYLDTLLAHVRENRDTYKLCISVAGPGMDQRGCAAWGRPICLIDRDSGAVYNAMWEYNVAHRDEIDVVFLASWNDYNEGHEIEPTLENGYRELVATGNYASAFKGVENKVEDSFYALPVELFHARKAARRLEAAGLEVSELWQKLDSLGQAIGAGSYERAVSMLECANATIAGLKKRVRVQKVACTVEDGTLAVVHDGPEGLFLRIEDGLAERLAAHYFEGYLVFSYCDANLETFEVHSASNKFHTVCQITGDGTGQRRPARVRIYKSNCSLDHSLGHGADFWFDAAAKAEDIRLEFEIYTKQ